MKRKFLYMFIIVICGVFCISFFTNNSLAVTEDYGYTINSYDIDMVVNEDNTFDITENITVYFYESRHGIYRKIPLKNSVSRLDGSSSNNRAKITDISVSENASIYNESGNKIIKIGDANITLTGEHSYTIKYKYDIGKDPLKDADELYFNLIGNEWDTSIHNVYFKITMPKEFDSSGLGFSSGYKGSTDSYNVTYSVEGNVITGEVLYSLFAGEALTVRLNLPEGYFVGNNNIDILPILSIVVMILCVVFVLIADRQWRKYGKDDEVIETVEFYPPEGYNSAEISFFYNGELDTKGVISLLVYLADKGYLKIEEEDSKIKGLSSKLKNFKITKLKEYDGNNEYEKVFFDGLFKEKGITDINKADKLIKKAESNGEKMSFVEAMKIVEVNSAIRESVTGTDLYDEFYIVVQAIIKKMNTKVNKDKIFEKVASSKLKYLKLMVFIIMTFITAIPVYNIGEGIEIMFNALACSLLGLFMIIVFADGASKKRFSVVSTVIMSILFGLNFWMPLVKIYLKQDSLVYIMLGVVGFISILVLVFFISIMPKRTKYGNEILGKLRGFKRFLETAEKSQLEALVNENPEYFYNILPYTYALGVSDVWMKKFETIAMKAPDWYVGYSSFNVRDFNSFMNTTMESAQTAMSSSSESSSGGGSSGGGSGGRRRRLLVSLNVNINWGKTNEKENFNRNFINYNIISKFM